MTLVKLIRVQGAPVWVNPDQVVHVEESLRQPGHTDVTLGTGTTFEIRGHPTVVVPMIEGLIPAG